MFNLREECRLNTVVTSREAILAQGRRLVQQEGWQALNIRSVAAACSISVGSVYHYFGSKAELMGEIVACVWRDVFHLPEDAPETDCFGAQVALLFDRLAEGERQYPGFFSLHSMGFLGQEKSLGQDRMARSWAHIQSQLCSLLRRDPEVRPGAFDGGLTPEKLVEIVFSQLLSALLRRDYDCQGLLELIRRAIY